MAEELRHLVWIERDHDAAAFLFNAIGRQARVLRLTGLAAGQCALDWVFPAGSAVQAMLPPDAVMADDAQALARGLATALDGARGLRALAVGTAARPEQVAAVLAHLSPDLLCAPRGFEMAVPEDAVVVHPVTPLTEIGLGDLVVWASDAAASWLDRALLRFTADWQARCAARRGEVNVGDLAALQGLRPVENARATALAWTGPHLRTVLLVPDFGGRSVRLTLHLAAARLPLNAEHFGIWIDGVECDAVFDTAGISVVAHELAPQPFRRLDLRHAELRRGQNGEYPAGCAIHAVTMERIA